MQSISNPKSKFSNLNPVTQSHTGDGGSEISIPKSSNSNRQSTILFLSLLFVFAIRQHSFTEPLEADEAIYMLIAQDWIDGGKPYVTTWDNKPIGTFLLYRVAIHLCGNIELAPRVLAFFSVAIATLILFALLRRAGAWSLGLGLLVTWPCFNALVDCHMNGANTEILLLPFLLACLYFTQKLQKTQQIYCFAAAIAAASLGALIKQVALPFLMLPFVPAILDKNWKKIPVYAVLCAIIVSALHLVIYAVCGYGAEVLVDQARQNSSYASITEDPSVFNYLKSLLTFPFHDPILKIAPVTLVGLIILGIAVYRTRKPEHVILASAYGCAILAVVMPARQLAHYYIIILPFILLSLQIDAVPFPSKARIKAGFSAVVFLYLAHFTFHDYLKKTPDEINLHKYQSNWFLNDRLIGIQLRDLGYSGVTAFADGSHPGILFYSGTKPAIPYLTSWSVGMGIVSADTYHGALMKAQPKLCIINQESVLRKFTGDWLDRHYTLKLVINDTKIFIHR